MSFTFLLTTAAALLAPDVGTLYGTVREAGTGEPISHATVQLPDLGRGVLADRRGYFVVPDVRAGRHRVVVRALGYEEFDAEVAVEAGRSVRLAVALRSRPVAVRAVEVTADAGGRNAAGPPPARITEAAIRALPALAEPDVLRTVQTLPSVGAASDFSSALYVRGGSPDQTAVTLDGVPLFNPYHLGGVFGAIDPDVVAGVDVHPGALPAGAEDRLSGVVAIRTREGSRDRPRGRGAVGMVSSRIALDGPLPTGGGSYLVSVRRTYLDLFTGLAQRLELTDHALPYAFTDAFVQVSHGVGSHGSLRVWSYLNTERFRLPERIVSETGSEMDFDWGSCAGALAYRHVLTPALVGEVRLGFSDFRGNFDAGVQRVVGEDGEERVETVPTFESRSRVHDLIGSADLVWHGVHHRLRMGVRGDAYRMSHVVEHRDPYLAFIPAFDRSDRPSTVAVHVEDDWTPTAAWSVRAGARVLHGGEHGTRWMPRLGVTWRPSAPLALSIGAGRYAQVLQSLRNEEALGASLLAYDLSAAVPAGTGFSTSEDLVVGGRWGRGATEVQVDAYLKRMDNLPLPPVPEEGILAAPMIVPDGFRTGTGIARGVEVLARQGWRGMTGTVSYALVGVERRVQEEHFPPRFERRHMLDAQAALPLGRWGSWSLRYQLGTGQPYTPVVGIAPISSYDPAQGVFVPARRFTLLLGEHNSGRLPGYSRLDAGSRWEFRPVWFGREVTVAPHLQILNVLNTRNVLVAMPSAGGGGPPVLNYAPQLPFFPTIGVELAW